MPHSGEQARIGVEEGGWGVWTRGGGVDPAGLFCSCTTVDKIQSNIVGVGWLLLFPCGL